MLHYRTHVTDQARPWVTFIHGAGGSSSIWYKQVKAFRKYFNLLLIDLRGHGQSEKGMWKKGDTIEEVADDVIEVLDHLQINSTHFVGISLGTIVIQTISQKYPNRIESMVLGGAITELDLRSRFLIALGSIGKNFLPYMWLYQLFAFIIMPKQNHKESRYAFVEQAKKVCQKEFMRWFSLTRKINPFLKKLQQDFYNIPTLFVMGEEDHLFLYSVKNIAKRTKEVELCCIRNAGHVCNIDQPERFNEVTISFINHVFEKR